MITRTILLPIVAVSVLCAFASCAHHSDLAPLSSNDLDKILEPADKATADSESETDMEATYEIEEFEIGAPAGAEIAAESDADPDLLAENEDKEVSLRLNGVLMPAYTGSAKPEIADNEVEDRGDPGVVVEVEETISETESTDILRPAAGSLKLVGGSGFVYMRSDYRPRSFTTEWQQMLQTLRPFSDGPAAN